MRTKLNAIACLFVAIFLAVPATAQEPAAIQIPTSNRQFVVGPKVAPVSLTTPARVLNQPRVASAEPQIRINIRYLMVDDATREAIYQELADQNLKTKMQGIADREPESPLATDATVLESSQAIFTTSCVTSCVLGAEETRFVIDSVSQSVESHISMAPSLILVDGQEGQMNDIVQRPFVAGIQSSNLPKQALASQENNTSNTPNVQVLDEGSALRVLAISGQSNDVHLSTEIATTKILGVETQRVFGVGQNSTMQVPQQQVEKAFAAERLQFGQTLLVDPYISQSGEVRVERGVPMLGKIPYINRAFKNIAVARTKLNMMVILEPMQMQ